jgi:glutaminyl-tRNA synthetase
LNNNETTFEKTTGALLYQVAAKIKSQIRNRLNFLVENTVNKNLNNEPQLTAALEYLLSNPNDPLDVQKFNEYCGVGVVVTPEQVKQMVTDVLNKHKAELLEKRYRLNQGILMSKNNSKVLAGSSQIFNFLF